ncbi:hypothetical protein ANN_08548 [Periplaneta americana]|uniref:Transposase n=1 Tax=Periplaneta americana TaxID=6978 RepID=A0ABQ8T386_PERAM|nr:hypothetical protein ANN_08548 [Periplaneta americana]
MAGLCEGGNEPSGSLKAICNQATKGNIEEGEFDPVLWIGLGVAQWSERLNYPSKLDSVIKTVILKKKLDVRKIAARWVPHNLTKAQKWHRYAIAQFHIQRYHNEGDVFLQRIVAIDETVLPRFSQHNLRPAMLRKRPHFLRDNPPFLLHDNARCHVAGAVAELLQR